MKYLIGIVLTLFLFIGTVRAADIDGVIVKPSGWPLSTIPIWRNEDAHDLAIRFLDAGQAYQALSQASCMVSPGTKAIRTSGFLIYKVWIASGSNIGCEGVIGTNFWRRSN